MAGLKLLAEVGLDGSGFETGIKRLEGLAHGFASGLKGFIIGAIGVGTVEQAISKTVETAKELINTSKRLSIAPEQLQLMREAAKDAGAELADMAGVFEKIDIAREKALMSGPKGAEMTAMFGALGVSPQMLRTQSAAQLFMGPLAKTAQNRNPEELGVLFRELGIKGFGPMIAVLKTDFGELSKKMKSYGAIMDVEAMVALKGFAEEIDLIGTVIVSHAAPALVKFAEILYKVAGGIAGWFSFIKGGISKLSWKEILGFLNPATLPIAITRFDMPSAKEAGAKTVDVWSKELDAIKKKIADDAEKLRHPKAPNFSTSSVPDIPNPKIFESHADSMTKVGNFLGGMGIAGQIEQKKVQLLTRIATGIDRLGGAKTGASFWGDSKRDSPLVPGPFHFMSGTNFPHS